MVRRQVCHCAELSSYEFVRWSGGIVPSILNHGTVWRWMLDGTYCTGKWFWTIWRRENSMSQ